MIWALPACPDYRMKSSQLSSLQMQAVENLLFLPAKIIHSTQYWWNVNVFPVSCENMIRCCNSMFDSNQMLHCNSCMFTWSIFTWVVAPHMILENVKMVCIYWHYSSLHEVSLIQMSWRKNACNCFFRAISNIVIVQLHYCHIIRHPSLPLGWRQNPPGTIN